MNKKDRVALAIAVGGWRTDGSSGYTPTPRTKTPRDDFPSLLLAHPAVR